MVRIVSLHTEGCLACPEPHCRLSLDAGLIDTHLVSTLLDAALPPTVLYRALQWLCLTARRASSLLTSNSSTNQSLKS